MKAMKSDSPELFDILDDHFTQLDSVPISSGVIFSDEHQKERYETLLMYVLRKYEAAVYHFENVRKFIRDEIKELEKAPNFDNVFNGKRIQMTFKFLQTADKYIYELAAFLEALKSSIDLLAEVCSFYLPGITTNYSISPLIKPVEKGKAGPILNEIATNLDWLKVLRDYRHHLVHRLMPSARSGYETRKTGEHAKTVLYPVVVPKSTPSSYVADTRASRIMQEDEDGEFPGLYLSQSEGSWVRPDGTKEIIHFSLDVTLMPDYMKIDDFMESHLHRYESFFAQIIQAFTKLKFKSTNAA